MTYDASNANLLSIPATLFCFKHEFITMYKTTSIALCTESKRGRRKLIRTNQTNPLI